MDALEARQDRSETENAKMRDQLGAIAQDVAAIRAGGRSAAIVATLALAAVGLVLSSLGALS